MGSNKPQSPCPALLYFLGHKDLRRIDAYLIGSVNPVRSPALKKIGFAEGLMLRRASYPLK